MMSKIATIVKLLKEDRGGFMASILLYFFTFLPDKVYLTLMFRFRIGYWINWKNPKTFSEKLQWLKLYNRCPEYTKMVDKYAVKEYVAAIIGEEYIIPTLGVWETPEEIDWNSLPNKFVLKTTHSGGSTGVIICKDKASLDKKEVINKLNKSYKKCIYKELREWPYKHVPKRIIAETYFEESNLLQTDCDLIDYKFYSFDGNPVYCQVIRNRRGLETIDFYDLEWNHMPFVGLNPVAKNGTIPVAKNGTIPVAKPICLFEMIDICRKLSVNIPFSRIDFYVVNNRIYFGEITFYPASGLGEFTPKEWNIKMGNLLGLPL